MKKSLLAVFVLFLCCLSSAHAAVVTMDQGDLYSTQYYGVGTMGGGRGIGFTVMTDFHMNTIGIDLGVPFNTGSALYEFDIFESLDGNTAGILLATTQFTLSQGEGWQDFALAFDFLSGKSYVINFTGANMSGLPAEFGVMYSWEPSALVNYGILGMVQGFEGAFPNNGNPLVPHFRINYTTQSVPEPQTLALFAFGLAGMGFAFRKK